MDVEARLWTPLVVLVLLGGSVPCLVLKLVGSVLTCRHFSAAKVKLRYDFVAFEVE